MSAALLLIDGYNLLHAAGMVQSEYRPGDLLRCRTRLLRLLHEKLSAAEIRGTTVVFDARDPPPDRPAQVIVSGIRVLFASHGGDADALIQEWLFRHPAPRRVTLVSSDKALQRAARSCAAKFIRSGEFLDELDRRRQSRATGRDQSAGVPVEEKPATHLSPAQTSYWLKVFGDVSTVEPQEADEPAPRSGRARVVRDAVGRSCAPSVWISKSPEPTHDAKPSAGAAREEIDYWMKVFGGPLAEPGAASPDELRLADLESWLRELDAGEL